MCVGGRRVIPSTFTSLAGILIRNLSVTLSTELIWSVSQKVGTRTPFKLNGTTLGGGGEILKSHYLLSVTTVFCPSTIRLQMLWYLENLCLTWTKLLSICYVQYHIGNWGGGSIYIKYLYVPTVQLKSCFHHPYWWCYWARCYAYINDNHNIFIRY